MKPEEYMKKFMEGLAHGLELPLPETRTYLHYLDENRYVERRIEGITRRVKVPMMQSPIPENIYYGTTLNYIHLYFGTGFRDIDEPSEELTVERSLILQRPHAFFGLYTANCRRDDKMYSPSLLAISEDLETLTKLGPKSGPRTSLKEFEELNKILEMAEGDKWDTCVQKVIDWYLRLEKVN